VDACKPGSELAIVNALRGRGGFDSPTAAPASGVDQAYCSARDRADGHEAESRALGVSTGNALDVALAVNA
jgi:hypothetical protein